MNKKNHAEIMDDILLLYELSLSIGKSLDLKTNCDNFLTTLMARKDLGFASVWIKNKYLPEKQDDGGASPIYANPEFQTKETTLSLAHPLFTLLEGKEFLSLSSQDSNFLKVVTEKEIKRGVFTIFALRDLGALKLFSITREAPFEGKELNQLRNVISKFTISLEGCLSHQRVRKEIIRRQQAEKELRRHQDHLEELVKERTEEIAAEKERLSVTLRSIGDGVITTDTQGKVVLINKVAEELTGLRMEEAAGRPLTEIFRIINEKTREPCEDPVRKVLETGEIIGLANDTVLMAKDGTERIIADSGSPIRDKQSKIIGAVLVFRDVTEKRKTQEEFQRTERLESIGLLAGGIAHDFNNILSAILLNAQVAKMSAKEDAAKYLEGIEKGIHRAASLTHQLLTFAKGGAPIKEAVTISELLIESAEFALHGSNTRPVFFLADNLFSTEIDRAQISQVINNLVINADQAMPEGGIIEIKVENVISGKEEGLPLELEKGKYVRISIKDTGVGIPREEFAKVFDPYWTTKHKGSGLGLTTVFSIIKKHDGYITLDSELGVGTTFYLYLPACKEKVSLEKEEAEQMILKGEGRILLMDDEEAILETTGEVLRELGYEVEIAKDGDEAINLYKKARIPFDLIIMDLTVPGGMGGKEAIKKLKEIDPGVKAIVSSGYSNDPVMADFTKYGFCQVAAKPYNIKELSQVLRKALGSS
ncbi:response regulator [bacterium]|nr:response regulator [bacterium]